MLAVLPSDRGHQLHADADAQERPARADHHLVQRFKHARQCGQAGLAIGEGADSRQNDAFGPAHRFGVAGDHDPGVHLALARRPLERLGGGAQISGTVIDDRDRTHARLRRGPVQPSPPPVPPPIPPIVPLVEGTAPAWRGSRLTAWRNARASALKQLSMI